MSLIPCKNFTFMGATVLEIAMGPVKGVGTKRLVKEGLLRIIFKIPPDIIFHLKKYLGGMILAFFNITIFG